MTKKKRDRNNNNNVNKNKNNGKNNNNDHETPPLAISLTSFRVGSVRSSYDFMM